MLSLLQHAHLSLFSSKNLDFGRCFFLSLRDTRRRSPVAHIWPYQTLAAVSKGTKQRPHVFCGICGCYNQILCLARSQNLSEAITMWSSTSAQIYCSFNASSPFCLRLQTSQLSRLSRTVISFINICSCRESKILRSL